MKEEESVNSKLVNEEICTEEKSSNGIRIRDREMFFTTDKWPRFPVLPLKRKHRQLPNKMQLGFVMASDRAKVYCGNIFEPDITKLEAITYDSVNELLIDGWVVD